jgi:hypothetical protein
MSSDSTSENNGFLDGKNYILIQEDQMEFN